MDEGALSQGPVHFIGIGGIGMSGLAEVLLAKGVQVQGSDLAPNANTERLAAKGARLFFGHRADNVANARLCVVSSAIRPENVERLAAKAAGIPLCHRAELLAALVKPYRTVAVSGTHGKTTTTAMIATLLAEGGCDPTVICGGVLEARGTNAWVGQGTWAVVEADESDGSFLKIAADVVVITNIDPEHLDHWGRFEALRAGFRDFAAQVSRDGVAVLCVDHPEVARLAAELSDINVIGYGFSPSADLRAEGVMLENGQSSFSITVSGSHQQQKIDRVFLPVPGRHNVSNALAAAAVGLHLGLSPETIRQGLAAYRGVARRFTRVGTIGGVTIVDDYAHHPAEIAATIAAARTVLPRGARLIAVHQPHRFTRLAHLFADFITCFDEADLVGLLPVYPAGEDAIPGATSEALAAALVKRGRPPRLLTAAEDLAAMICAEARAGDLVLCLGAGTISAWARALPQALAARGFGCSAASAEAAVSATGAAQELARRGAQTQGGNR